ncbi:hypothetical protein J6A31_09130 [bacterium]|nr:hypothetical protein [bacterium]
MIIDKAINSLKPGDIVWACAYEYSTHKETHALLQRPIIGMISQTDNPTQLHMFDDTIKYCHPTYFIPFKKNPKALTPENLAFSKAVQTYSRRYATTEAECNDLFNRIIQEHIEWHEDKINALKSLMIV